MALACAPRVSVRVPPEAIGALPLERRLTLLDAESERLAAVDARDGLEERALAAEDALRLAGARQEAAEGALAKMKKAKKPTEVADAVLAESVARVLFATRDLDLQRARLRTGELSLLVAEARYERSRAAEVESAGLAAAWKIKPGAFEDQVAALEAAAGVRAAEEARAKEQAAPARAAWEKAREKLSQLTGGARGSAWVE